jgi:hypothetical protein
MGEATVMRLSIKCVYVTLLLPRDVSVAGNLEMADYNAGSDEELVETAVVAAAGLMMIEAINAERAKKRERSRSMWVKPIFHRRGQIGAHNLLMITASE